MRCWVLEVKNTLSRPIREWVVAPSEIVVSEINHDSGVINKTQHKDHGNDVSFNPNDPSAEVEIADQPSSTSMGIFDENTSTSTEKEIFSARFFRFAALLKNSTGDIPSGTVRDIEGLGVTISSGFNFII